MPQSPTFSEVVYGRGGERPLALDLYLPPESAAPAPLIIWIHGGGWRQGDKAANVRAVHMVEDGYAVASVGYRLSDVAIFPAQIHDCKAAVRWLRTNAATYGIDPERFGAWGPSAGGHLVALLGTSAGVSDLEGEGGNPGMSTRIQAVCDWFGPTDLLQMSQFPSQMDHDAANSPESLLVGGPIQERPEVVARVNPITYITGDEPPFLIMHGEADPLVPPNQSVLLYDALRAAGVEARLEILPDAGHGGEAFGAAESLRLVETFFETHLR